jgi:glutamyl-tRNA synthetase
MLVDFLFLDEPLIDEDSWKKTFGSPDGVEMLNDAIAALSTGLDWNHDSLKLCIEAAGAARGLKLGKAQAPIRVAVTGRTIGPPLFEALELMGEAQVMTRLRAAAERLASA